MTIGLFSHPLCKKHDMGDLHPECPARLDVIEDQLISSGLDYLLKHYQPMPASKETLLLAHDRDYIESIFARSPTEGHLILDADTSMNPFSLDAALLSAGAAVMAVDKVMNGEISVGFCATRPPGHHAEKDRAMGFCIFNNIAIAGIYAKQRYQLDRIAIVDFDVHHGNGTQAIISDKPGFLFCSSFEHPLYPYSGTESHPAHIINSPLASGSSGAQFREVISRDWLPALEKFKPQLLLISAGFDAHAEDSISSLRLHESDYEWVTLEIKKIADRYCQGKTVSLLEGGYQVDALARSVITHLKALMD